MCVLGISCSFVRAGVCVRARALVSVRARVRARVRACVRVCVTLSP